MSALLQNIENKLQQLLEGTLDRIFYPGISQALSSQLVTLIDEALKAQTADKLLAPDLITIAVSPEKMDAWQESEDTLKRVAREIEGTWTELGYHFRSHPVIHLKADPDIAVENVKIYTAYSQADEMDGKTAPQLIPHSEAPEPVPSNAYFIIDAKEHVRLTKSVISVGRRSSSDVVIKDPMVSRDHLQLRAQKCRYVLFDLSSTGGTYVNNKTVKSVVLKPGDVIRVGRTILIFSQELPGLLEGTRVLPMGKS